ncbi:MAG: right-handed parallel beta-helix repeat-containing protein [Planctomycetota bacterium]|jgi:hypothetical protein
MYKANAGDDIQQAFDNYREVLLLEGAHLTLPLSLPDGRSLFFEEKAKLIAHGAYGLYDPILTCAGSDNRIQGEGGEIYFPYDPTYIAEDGRPAQWHHCISARSARNLIILGLKLTSRGGDGICLGTGLTYNNNRNPTSGVWIKYVTANECFRDGLVLGCCKEVEVEDSEFNNSHGIAGQAGIACEPNYSHESVQVKFTRVTARGNYKYGCQVHLSQNAANIRLNFQQCILEALHGAALSVQFSPGVPDGCQIHLNDCDLYDSEFESAIHCTEMKWCDVLIENSRLCHINPQAPYPSGIVRAYWTPDTDIGPNNFGSLRFNNVTAPADCMIYVAGDYDYPGISGRIIRPGPTIRVKNTGLWLGAG